MLIATVPAASRQVNNTAPGQTFLDAPVEMNSLTDETPMNNSQLAQLNSPVFRMNTVTSALISGIIILGVMSMCFFIFSLTLLKGSRAPPAIMPGAHNSAFN
ncbi:hypothetical protein UPYG_G00111990 [Umbra pygmaea]|uniref:Uncharacterized protein n=1 Tax=Umbra pygmaea TaxID=75934 RepID=A0ABD0X338_UMBPY